MSSFVTASNTTLGVSAKANIINCWFVVDNSGSMAGNKMELAKKGVLNCIDQLTESDHFGILTFSSAIELVTTGRKGEASLSKFHSVRADGGTALYDAILKAGALSWALHRQLKQAVEGTPLNVKTYMVLLTDGEDTSSNQTQEDVKAFLSVINKTRDFKIILAGVGLSQSAASIMRGFGSVGDNDIEFRELKSNNDIKELFEHFTIVLRETRTAAVMNSQGGFMVNQTREFDLTSGNVNNNTTVLGYGSPNMNSSNNKATPLLTDTSRVKEVPSTLQHFWDFNYDLNAYETKALYGVCCFQFCCLQCCCLPGTLDHCFLTIPSCTIGNCCVGECFNGLTFGTCGLPFLFLGCPCIYANMCRISCSVCQEGYQHRYEETK